MNRTIFIPVKSGLATVLVASVLVVTALGNSPAGASPAPFSGGFSPTIVGNLADLNGDGLANGADDSNAFYGDTSIIDGALDCDGWVADNDGTAGDGTIDTDDDCTLIGYDGTVDGVTITVTDGAFQTADGPLPTVFNATDPDNPSVVAADFAWSAIDGRVDSNGNGTIDPDDCHFGIIGDADVLGSDPGCGFAGVIDPSLDGLVDLNGDGDITAADTCLDGCFFGHDVNEGLVSKASPTITTTLANSAINVGGSTHDSATLTGAVKTFSPTTPFTGGFSPTIIASSFSGGFSPTIIASSFSGGFSPTIVGNLADLNGDGVGNGADDSNAFYGDTSIIDGALDCDTWGATPNAGTAGDGTIGVADDCTLIGYDGTADGVTITVTGGAFQTANGPLPTVFNAADPDNPSVVAADFAWSTIDGRVDSNGNGTIDPDDCHFGIIGDADILGSDPGCGFAVTPDPSLDGLVDLNGDGDITAADTCLDGCFFGHDVFDGRVDGSFLADLNGDGVADGADDSNAFYGDTSIIDGALDCDAWATPNAGTAGNGTIDRHRRRLHDDRVRRHRRWGDDRGRGRPVRHGRWDGLCRWGTAAHGVQRGRSG
jgi:hypothetical protein